jgi:hypothetical protein
LRRALVAALVGATALLLLAGTADAALEPVTITANAPGTVTAGVPFKLEVAVEAEPGALDIAAQPLLVGVKLAPECGGSLVGTPGGALFEQTLPTVPAGSAVNQTFSAQVTTSGSGTEVVCAYLQDSQERQFATDTEAEVTVLTTGEAAAQQKQCTAATKRLTESRQNLKRLNKRIRKVRRELRHARGAHRKTLKRKLHKLRAKHRKLAKQRRKSTMTVAGACS